MMIPYRNCHGIFGAMGLPSASHPVTGGVFGALHEFRKKFANPILRGREPTASPEERAKAEATVKGWRMVKGWRRLT